VCVSAREPSPSHLRGCYCYSLFAGKPAAVPTLAGAPPATRSRQCLSVERSVSWMYIIQKRSLPSTLTRHAVHVERGSMSHMWRSRSATWPQCALVTSFIATTTCSSSCSDITFSEALAHDECTQATPSLLLCRYDRTNSFRKMVDCQFVAAMGPPGGGRNFITPRYARHFHHVGICDFDAKSMHRIFGTILDWSLAKVSYL
jgi:hypothetical protein